MGIYRQAGQDPPRALFCVEMGDRGHEIFYSL
jgi:hypothetical protein